jgi:hypothetical protein
MKHTIWMGGMIIMAAACWGGTQGGHRLVERHAQWTLPQEGTRNLEVRTPAGDIRVVIVEGNRLEVQARIAVRGGSPAEAEALLEEIKVEPRRTPGGWLVAASWQELLQGRGISPRVNFVVQVPRTMRLDLTTADGTLEIEDQTHSEVGLAIDHPSGRVPAELSAGNGATQMRLDAGTSLHLHLRSPIRLRTWEGAVRLRSEG